jgi:hypothetical protein
VKLLTRVCTDDMVRLVRTHAVCQAISRALARTDIKGDTSSNPLSGLQETRQHV